MGKVEKAAVPTALAAGYLYYILTTPANFDAYQYFSGLAVIFALGAKAMAEDTDKYFVLVGYLFWNLAYCWQIYYGFKEGLSAWPLFTGAYYIVNEFLTCCTNMFETPQETGATKYITPLYVKFGYYIFMALDLFLNLMTIYLGTGSDYDELGLWPMQTMTQRAAGFAFWCAFWLFMQVKLAGIFGPRQTKYSMAAFQYICQVAVLRLPVFQQIHMHSGISTAMKFQTFGSAFYVVRVKAPCSPQILFRSLLFFMAPYQALTASVWFKYINLEALSTEMFMSISIAWLVGFWFVLIGLNKIERASSVRPAVESVQQDVVQAS